ncbi:MAG: hypothetical protein P1U74_09075 [Legionellaceae bacterium]|nr:hypothetical protein [Legionellaceae bacterium]
MALTRTHQDKSLRSTGIKKFAVNYKFVSILFIIAMSFAVNLPSFVSGYYPIHDTLTVFHFFSHYYSQLINTNELPLWLPYTTYGMPIESYVLFSLGPFQYLTIAIGYLFKIQNTLTLFSISLVGDTIFLAFGTYLLCNHIFKNYLVTCICVTFLLLLAQYDQQLYWNFKVLIPIPMALYLGQKWVESLNPVFLISGLATLLITSFGSLPYALAFQFYVVSCYCIALVTLRLKWQDYNRKLFKDAYVQTLSHLHKKRNIILLTVLIVSLIICALMFIHIKLVMTNELTYSENIGRSNKLFVPLRIYLKYGGYTGLEKISEMLTGIPHCHQNLLPFSGLICISFTIYGLCCKPRSNAQIALLITFLFIVLFSIEKTTVARIIYYFPMMNLFRHIAYVITMGKIFLTILSGFGISAYLNKK